MHMNPKIASTTIATLVTFMSACTSSDQSAGTHANDDASDSFKVIGYYYYVPSGPTANELDLTGLTHINYSFALPAKESNGLEPLAHPDNLRNLVGKAHQANTKVFISLGGWNIGDGGGNDERFHRMAADEEGRQTFVNEVMTLVNEYNLDGVDMDWEYPDNDSSADDFVVLMKTLSNALHRENKKLTLAVVSYDGRLSSIGKVASGEGIKDEIFEIVDWVNIMAYDDENGKVYPDNAHSTYALAEKCLTYWIDQRGLPARKAVLGLPFYAKPGYISYKALLAKGANPSEDSFEKVFYNGAETMKAKTELALSRGCGGVMIWEISQDAAGEHSLVRAINQAIVEHRDLTSK